MVLFMKLPTNLEDFEAQLFLFQKKGFKLVQKHNQFVARKNRTVVYLTK